MRYYFSYFFCCLPLLVWTQHFNHTNTVEKQLQQTFVPLPLEQQPIPYYKLEPTRLFPLDRLSIRYTSYHQNGVTIKTTGLLNDHVREGIWNYYYESGQLAATGRFVNGYLEGLWLIYHDNGNLAIRAHFHFGEKVKEHEVFYYNGLLKCYQRYLPKPYLSADLLASTPPEFWTLEKIKAACSIKNIDYEHYMFACSESYDCQEYSPARFLDMYHIDQWCLYYRNGKPQLSGTFVKETLVGTWKSYHPNGQVASINYYNKHGKRQGDALAYSPTGDTVYHAKFQAGIPVSPLTFYYHTGEIRATIDPPDSSKVMLEQHYYRYGQMYGASVTECYKNPQKIYRKDGSLEKIIYNTPRRYYGTRYYNKNNQLIRTEGQPDQLFKALNW